jgi:hypothetical protein
MVLRNALDKFKHGMKKERKRAAFSFGRLNNNKKETSLPLQLGYLIINFAHDTNMTVHGHV